MLAGIADNSFAFQAAGSSSKNIDDRRTTDTYTWHQKVEIFRNAGNRLAKLQSAFEKLSSSGECSLSKDELSEYKEWLANFKKADLSDVSLDEIPKLDKGYSSKTSDENLTGVNICTGSFRGQRTLVDEKLSAVESNLSAFEFSFLPTRAPARRLFAGFSRPSNNRLRPVCQFFRNKASQPVFDYLKAFNRIYVDLKTEKDLLESYSLKLATAYRAAKCQSVK